MSPAAPAGDGIVTIFVKNLPWAADENAVGEFFTQCGEVSAVRIPLDAETGRPRGFCHVDFLDEAGCEKAYAMSGVEFMGRELFIDKARPREPRQSWGGDGGNGGGFDRSPRFPRDEGFEVFVKGFDGNMGEDAVRAALQEKFSEAGEILNISLPVDRETGGLKGIGFIKYGSAEEQGKAGEFNYAEVAGGQLRSGGGRGRGGFGGRGGGRGGRGGGFSIDASGGGSGANKKVTFD
eukprot:PRCOL_00004810-RA